MVSLDIHKKIGDFHLDVSWSGQSRRLGILGESGCGKSMTLQSIAGIVQPDDGRIVIEGKVIYDSSIKLNVKPQKRNVGYLFQNYALFPTMTVAENVACGCQRQSDGKPYSKKDCQARVQEMLRRYHIEELRNRYPDQLSGGQQQRTALARIMAGHPKLLLLDEPFSALDWFLKDRMQQELLETLQDYQGIVILVSHDRDEIYRFCDTVMILHEGSVIAAGPTREIFQDPGMIQAAKLTGCKNIVTAKKIGEQLLFVPDWKCQLATGVPVPDDVKAIGIRAHDFLPVWDKEGLDRENVLPFYLSGTSQLPFEWKYFFKTHEDQEETICWFVQRPQWEELQEKGMPAGLEIPKNKILLLKR